MDDFPPPLHIREVLRDIVEGRSVKRAKHDLRWGLTDLTTTFIDALQENGYHPMDVHDVHIIPGERVPAFYIEHGTAYFGWVFWEKFSSARLRKLFGSAIRNARGDWEIQIPSSRKRTLYVNMDMKYGMDVENPSGL